MKLNKNIEIIIVENGSTDKTNENIIKSDLYKHNKINLVIIKKNLGYGFGIMSGVYKASGNFIGWCHADLQTEPLDIYEAFIKNKEKLEKNNCVVKGPRKKRHLLDNIFTLGMSVIVSMIFIKKINDINAQPKLFPKSIVKYMKNSPNDFYLHLFFLIMASINNFKIINYEVIMKKRVYGEAKGGGSIRGKFKLIKRTMIYILKLRIKLWK